MAAPATPTDRVGVAVVAPEGEVSTDVAVVGSAAPAGGVADMGSHVDAGGAVDSTRVDEAAGASIEVGATSAFGSDIWAAAAAVGDGTADDIAALEQRRRTMQQEQARTT